MKSILLLLPALFFLTFVKAQSSNSNTQPTAFYKSQLKKLSKEIVLPKDNASSKEKIEQKPWFVSRYSFTAGGFFPINDAKVSLGATDGSSGTEIDFEDDLNLDKNTQTFLLGGDVHLGKRHKLELTYFRFYRNASATLNREIAWGDSIYPVDASVKGFFNNNIFRFSYGYAFLTNSKVEAGLLFGLHVVKSQMGIQVNGATQSVDKKTDFDLTAPLPDFGVWGNYAFSDKWAAGAEFDYFALKINDVDGRILGANVKVAYRAWDRVLVSAGYTGFNFRIEAKKNNKEGFMKWGYNGPSIQASYLLGVKGKGSL